jgi:hypothetical protein
VCSGKRGPCACPGDAGCSEERLPLATEKLAEILKDCGFETHPKGMAQPSAADIEQSSDGKSAYFDVNADAVRNNGEVPERPIRLTFDRAKRGSGNTSAFHRTNVRCQLKFLLD